MDVKIGTRNFTISKMDPFTQFHVLRRMGPLFPSVSGALKAPDKLQAVGYVAAALSRLTDDDANFIIKSCLTACRLKQGTVLAPVVDATGALMFQDLALQDIMELVWEVIKENYAPFMQDLLARVFGGEVPA